MNELITSRPITLGQLQEETEFDVRLVGPYPDGTYKVKADVDLRTLQSAVEAHVPDPDWSPPPEEPTERDVKRARLRELVAKTRLTEEEEREYRELTVELLIGEEEV